jgi:hypothetical protein
MLRKKTFSQRLMTFVCRKKPRIIMEGRRETNLKI